MKIGNNCFSSLYCLMFQMFVILQDINSRKSGLLHLTGHPYCKKGRSAKVKNGIINKKPYELSQ